MTGRGLGVLVVCVLALGGCGREEPSADASRSTPVPASSPVASPAEPTEPTEPTERATATGSASPAPTPEPSGPQVREASRRLLRDAVDALLDEPVVDFRHTLSTGGFTLSETTGRAFAGDSWRASTAFHDPQADDDVQMDTRSLGGAVFMQMLDWDDDMAGCWLRMGPGVYPVGQLAMTPDVPVYVSILDALRAYGLDPDSDSVLLARTSLTDVLQLLTGQAVEHLDLTAAQARRGEVAVRVYLDDGALTDISLDGTDLVDALASSGADLSEEVAATLRSFRVAVRYRAAPAEADPVTAPDASLVVDFPADADTPGCRA